MPIDRSSFDYILISRILGLKEKLSLSQKALNVLLVITEYKVRYPDYNEPIRLDELAHTLKYSDKTVLNALSELRMNKIIHTRTKALDGSFGYIIDLQDVILMAIHDDYYE